MAPLATLTLLDEDCPLQVLAVVDADGVRLSPDVVQRSLGWRLEAAGLCRGDTCVPVRPEHGLLRDDGLDLRALASPLERPLALAVEARIACVGASPAARGPPLRSGGTGCARWMRRSPRCPISAGIRTASRSIAGARCSCSPGLPGEDAGMTCRSGRHCTRSWGR